MAQQIDPVAAWRTWGEPAGRAGLPERLRSLIDAAFGLDGSGAAVVDRDDVELPEPALGDAARSALAAAVGEGGVRDDSDSRLAHAGGMSMIELLRRRAGDVSDAPDAIVSPASHEEVLAVLHACEEHGVAVVPFGGGTSVVGGVAPVRGRFGSLVALDLGRMRAVVEVDDVSRTATLEPGLPAPEAEALLNERGYTLGHWPQSWERATIGGFAAARSSGQMSSGYGRFDDMVVALRVATPRGELRLGRAPRSAAGPDLRHLFLGSEGVLGVITEVTVSVRPRPAATREEGWHFPGFAEGAAALRALAQDGALPDVARLSDEAATALGLATAGDSAGGAAAPAGGCLLVCGWEGDTETMAARALATAARLQAVGGSPLGPEPGEAWRRGRFGGAYLRDDLLDAGVLAETLETATSWSRLHDLHGAVAGALRGALGERSVVMCHISHVYAAGASLYFTAVAAAGDDPIARWQEAKRAAGDAIAACGATITHHHAVGTDHRPWMEAEVGALGVEILRAVKERVDPAGILNPGKLI